MTITSPTNPNLLKLFKARHFTFFKLALLGRFTSQPQHHWRGFRRLRLLSTGTSALAAGGRSRLASCGAYCRPPLRFGLGCHSPSVLSRALPSATFRVAKPYDTPSALRHGVNTRPKGHCGPLTCKTIVGKPRPTADFEILQMSIHFVCFFQICMDFLGSYDCFPR